MALKRQRRRFGLALVAIVALLMKPAGGTATTELQFYITSEPPGYGCACCCFGLCCDGPVETCDAWPCF